MKRQNSVTRFYLWDYIWWLGERLSQDKRDTRIDGALLLTVYLFDFPINPLIITTTPLIPKETGPQLLFLALWVALTLGAMALISRYYRSRRGKAVMRHYAGHRFAQIHALLIFVLAIALLCLELYLAGKFISIM